jgi:hypothetical protein
MQIQQITTNLAPAVRHETLNGKEHLVVPMVMITHGVHAGSNGPLYYPAKELAKLPVVWNMKPVVVYHPQANGQGVTATDPDVLAKQSVGVIMNTSWDADAGKLRAEAWLDRDRLQAVDNRVLQAIEANTVMEVSTGLFTENDYEPGTHDGQEYEFVARNYRPDHLAILPDKVGACSVADGAGLLQLNQLSKEQAVAMRQQLDTLINNTPSGKDGKMSAQDLVAGLIENTATAWSEDDREFLEQQDLATLEKMVPIDNGYGKGKKAKAKDDDEDEEKMADNANAGPAEEATAEPASTPQAAAPAPVEPALADNDDLEQQQQPATAAEYIAAAPPEIRDVLEAGLAAHNEQRAKLIGGITANSASTYTQEQLQAKPMAELQQLHQLASVKKSPAVYAGKAAPTGNATAPVAEGLPRPTMQFD